MKKYSILFLLLSSSIYVLYFTTYKITDYQTQRVIELIPSILESITIRFMFSSWVGFALQSVQHAHDVSISIAE